MENILYQDPNIKYVREDLKARCIVRKVNSRIYGGQTSVVARYNLAAPHFDSPYLSWENLGDVTRLHDTNILETAVPKGKRLVDMGYITYNVGNTLTKAEALRQVEVMDAALPEEMSCVSYAPVVDRYTLYVYVFREGYITDFFDLDQVFNQYRLLGYPMNDDIQELVRELCRHEIRDYAGAEAPFSIDRPASPAGNHPDIRTELSAQHIVSGLLRGHPLESTAYQIKDLIKQRDKRTSINGASTAIRAKDIKAFVRYAEKLNHLMEEIRTYAPEAFLYSTPDTLHLMSAPNELRRADGLSPSKEERDENDRLTVASVSIISLDGGDW